MNTEHTVAMKCSRIGSEMNEIQVHTPLYFPASIFSILRNSWLWHAKLIMERFSKGVEINE